LIDYVYLLDVSADGRHIVSSSADDIITAYNNTKGVVLWKSKVSASAISLRIHGTEVFVLLRDSTIVVLDLHNGEEVYTIASGQDMQALCVFEGEGLILFPS
jgi:outer membrane protein assembly factor BamB